MVRFHSQSDRFSYLFHTDKIYTGIGILFLQFIILVGKFSPWDGSCEVGHPTIHFRVENISDKTQTCIYTVLCTPIVCTLMFRTDITCTYICMVIAFTL